MAAEPPLLKRPRRLVPVYSTDSDQFYSSDSSTLGDPDDDDVCKWCKEYKLWDILGTAIAVRRAR